jgi:hypothetical protein
MVIIHRNAKPIQIATSALFQDVNGTLWKWNIATLQKDKIESCT